MTIACFDHRLLTSPSQLQTSDTLLWAAGGRITNTLPLADAHCALLPHVQAVVPQVLVAEAPGTVTLLGLDLRTADELLCRLNGAVHLV